MSSRKRNEFLDSDRSEDDEAEVSSEQEEESKLSRAVKRRRISKDEDEDSGFSSGGDEQDETIEDNEAQDFGGDVASDRHSRLHEGDGFTKAQAQELKSPSESRLDNPSLPRPLESSRRPTSKTGVIYLSRVPPFMKPSTVKRLLSSYGTVTRLFLTPEDPVIRQQRLRSGGNKKRTFTDGWIEFARKRDAKLVAETLNASIIGGKKGSWYHDDVWNIRYLKGFKWHHLTEQIANENAERAARLRRDIAEARKEDKRFVQNVERAKMLDGIERKKKMKAEQLSVNDVEPGTSKPEQLEQQANKLPRHFKQNKTRTKEDMEAQSAKQPEEVSRVLNKIF